jgi:invasion protein IalB
MVSAEAAEAWRAAERSNNVVALEKFILRYKDTFYADLARARIDEINRPTPAAPASYWTSKPIPAWTGPKVAPPMKTTDRYWVKLCEHVNSPSLANGADICMTTHERLDANTGLPVASAAVREIDKRPDRQLLVLVPLGVQQQPGIQVNFMRQDAWTKWHTGQPFDESAVKRVTVPISLCTPTGCTGEMPVTPELSEMLKSRAGIVLAAVHSSGPAYGVPIPLFGFDETLNGPPMDSKLYGEARRKLMQQLAERQAAAKEAAAKAAKEKKN